MTLFLAVAAILSLVLFNQRMDQPIDAQELKATEQLKWYRGNLHTHSLWSDGDDFLENIGRWYRDHDYQFLVFTDHNVIADRERWISIETAKGGRKAFDKLQKNWPKDWAETRERNGQKEVRLKTFQEVAGLLNEPGKFLVIQGEEISDKFSRFPVHLNVSNVKELIPPLGGESVADVIQNNVNALLAQRERTKQPMLIHVNHPNFGFGVTAEDLMRIRGANFFEVYNGHPWALNLGDRQHARTGRVWDIVNTRRLTEFGLPLMYGLATDDGHHYHQMPSRESEPGRGWIVVLATDLSAGALINAMERGRFYASTGVMLDSIKVTSRSMEVVVKAEPKTKYLIEFIGTLEGFDPTHEPILDRRNKVVRATMRYSQDMGDVLARVESDRATYKFTGKELFVRARVTSNRKHPNPADLGEFERAWVQPTIGPAGKAHQQ